MILILGKGFIGKILHKATGWKICGTKIRNLKDAERVIKRYRPKVLVNCIGAVGRRNVDDCDLDKDHTLLSNCYVPILLSEAAGKKIKLVHISSGCIYNYDYNKDKPITEDKVPDYIGLLYSRSKIYSERALSVFCEQNNILIARLRIPLLNYSHPRNILDKLIKFGNFTDIPNSVSYIPDFIKALRHLIKIDARGIYNVVNKGGLRYPVLMDVYKKYAPAFTYGIIPLGKRGTTRTDLILSTKKLEKTGFKVRHIHEVLDECVRGYLGS